MALLDSILGYWHWFLAFWFIQVLAYCAWSLLEDWISDVLRQWLVRKLPILSRVPPGMKTWASAFIHNPLAPGLTVLALVAAVESYKLLPERSPPTYNVRLVGSPTAVAPPSSPPGSAPAGVMVPGIGTEAAMTRRWDLRGDVGERLPLGTCDGKPCFLIELAEIGDKPPGATAQFHLRSVSSDGQVSNWFRLKMPLRKGCTRVASKSPNYELHMTVVDDSYQKPEVLLAWIDRGKPSPNPGQKDYSRLAGMRAMPAGRIVCGDQILVCMKHGDADPRVTEDDVACLQAGQM